MGFDASGRLYKQKIDELREYMEWKDLDPITCKKIFKYYDLKYQGKYFEENNIFDDLNESLRMEIAVHNCKELVRRVPFLNRQQRDGRDELFLGRIASALVSCYYVAGDVLFFQGQMGEDMYFILSGMVYVLVNGKRVTSMSEGAFFGEPPYKPEHQQTSINSLGMYFNKFAGSSRMSKNEFT
ncbi:cyclic nucleotide-binding-like protein [Chytriomyces sp. MP71]|nr:cyclic nucleotide-binding-like protein [Chytriomyces sp. MP71]